MAAWTILATRPARMGKPELVLNLSFNTDTYEKAFIRAKNYIHKTYGSSESWDYKAVK